MITQQKKAIFVTGGSGFLGAHFIWHVLTKTDYHIVANMRDATHSRRKKQNADAFVENPYQSGKQRLLKTLEKTAHSLGLSGDRIEILQTLAKAPGRISIVLNDLTAQDGVNTSDFSDEMKQFVIRECWHFAGFLTPEKELFPKHDFGNVTMTENALKLSEAMGVTQFFHISTAYASGRSGDLIPEQAFDYTLAEPVFRNSYERSKYLAEQKSGSFCERHNMKLTILRPSIVIGARMSKDSGGSISGFYGVLKAFWRLGGRKLKQSIKIPVAQGAGLDLIPVDDFLEEVWQIREEHLSGKADHKVYHLCAGKTVDPDKVILMAAEQYNAPVEAMVIEALGQETISAKVLASQLDFYQDYVGRALSFERRRTPPPALSDVDILNYITSVARTLEYGSVEEVFEISLVQGHQGALLPVFDSGEAALDGQTVLFCNAMAMGADILVPLASHLKKAGHRLVTWDSRVLPTLTPDFEAVGSSLEVHARDGIAIMENLGLTHSSVQVAGWSTGAGVAAKLVHLSPSALAQLLLVSGSFMLEGTELTPFQRNMNLVMPRVAGSRAMTKQLFHLAFAPPEDQKWWDLAGKLFRSRTDRIMRANDPRLEHITRQPVRNSETAYRYACQISDYMHETDWEWLKEVEVPTWVMACEDDGMTHPSGSYRVHEMIQSSVLKIYQEGDHFKLYQDQAFFDDFIAAITRDECVVRKEERRLAYG